MTARAALEALERGTTYRLVPVPWAAGSRGVAALPYARNRWRCVRVDAKGAAFKLANSEAAVVLAAGAVAEVRGRFVLLNAQLVIDAGRVTRQPLPKGYWDT